MFFAWGKDFRHCCLWCDNVRNQHFQCQHRYSLSSSVLLSLDAFVSLTSAAANLEVRAAHLPEPQGVHVPSLAESVHGCKLSWYIFCRLYGRSLFSLISGNYIPSNEKNIERSPHAGSPQGAFCSPSCVLKYYTLNTYFLFAI